jgi:naphthoate synthase
LWSDLAFNEERQPMTEFTDISYEVDNGLAWITINRPERYNAFRARTLDELIRAFKLAWGSPDVGVICLTGAGEKAFCTGGDQKQRAETGDYGPSETGLFEVDTLHRVIRDVPKPVIAAVNGFAIGGGHVLHVLCDLTIAADTAVFGQNGPRVGSFDAGFGTGYLARVVGEKRAREICSCAAGIRRSRQRSGDWSTRWCLPTSSSRRCGHGPMRS